jgi:hypothetical protein
MIIPGNNSATPATPEQEQRLAAQEAQIQLLMQGKKDSDQRAENSSREAAVLDACAGFEFVNDHARASFLKEAVEQMERGPGGTLRIGSQPAREGIRGLLAGEFSYTLASSRPSGGTKPRAWTMDDIKPGMAPEDLKAIQAHIQSLLPGRGR